VNARRSFPAALSDRLWQRRLPLKRTGLLDNEDGRIERPESYNVKSGLSFSPLTMVDPSKVVAIVDVAWIQYEKGPIIFGLVMTAPFSKGHRYPKQFTG